MYVANAKRLTLVGAEKMCATVIVGRRHLGRKRRRHQPDGHAALCRRAPRATAEPDADSPRHGQHRAVRGGALGTGSGFRFAAEAFAAVVAAKDFAAGGRAAQASLGIAATLEAIVRSARLGWAVDMPVPAGSR